MSSNLKPKNQKTPKVVKSEAPKSKPQIQPQINKKQINEIIILVIIIIVVGVVFYLTAIKKPVEETVETPVIPTDFEEQSLNELKKRDSNYPAINIDDLGKPNPFSN